MRIQTIRTVVSRRMGKFMDLRVSQSAITAVRILRFTCVRTGWMPWDWICLKLRKN